MSEHTPTFAEVILPLSLRKNYTYEIPEELLDQAEVGRRVIVQFGKKRYYTALLYKIHQQEPEIYKAKPVVNILDDVPIVTPKQLRLWEWLSEYYLCNLGDVMNAALPAGLKLASETKVLLHPDYEDDFSKLDDKEYLIAEALTIQKQLTIKEMQEILDLHSVYPIIRNLLEKGVIFLQEEIQEGYKPRMEEYLSLAEEYSDQEKRKELFAQLEKAPKQLEALMHFFQLRKKEDRVKKADLSEVLNKNYAAINTLIKKGILIGRKEEVSRLAENAAATETGPVAFSTAQKDAFEEIKEKFGEKEVVLLHGVTGSGKTEIYIELMKEVIEKGQQVLYLLPEISLTAQIVTRLKKFFGNDIGIYHSRFSDNERVEIWNKILKGEYKIVLGARSALFLPFRDLGMIIVDEEHDPSYKQFDPAPRYNARDAAIFLATLDRAKVLLGTATPSLESHFNAAAGKYAEVRLLERYGNVEMPKIRIVDVSKSARVQKLNSHLSEALLHDLKVVLDNKEQAILFRNRRGYAPMLICGTCGFVPQCVNCDVSLTYHKLSDQLKCHYCGHTRRSITTCPACAAHHMQLQGFGTEKIEDELSIYFKDAKVGRMDYDAVKSKWGHQKVINEFETGNIDILVGTQMVTKGLDFEKVAMVGIINSDQLLQFPDFRAGERAFQLMVQVAGRAGRKKQGAVLIQARDVYHPILRLVVNSDFEHFFATELAHRRKFRYPPYVRLIKLHIRHKNRERLYEGSEHIFKLLKRTLSDRVLPPTPPAIGRVRNYYLMEIIIKLERKKDVLHTARATIHKVMDLIATHDLYKSLDVYADVDPY